MKKQIPAIILCVALFGGLFYVLLTQREATSQEPKAPQPIELPVFVVSPSDMSDAKEFNARISANKTAQIRPQVSGVIKKRLFEEGALVQEGDQLYLIDPAPYDAALANAKAQLQKAVASNKAIKAKVGRYNQLIKAQAISKQEYDNGLAGADVALADIEIAKATVRTAELNVQYTKVYAPISGKIGFSKVTEGALVTANQVDELATITQIDGVYADLTAQATDISALQNKAGVTGQQMVKLVLGDGKTKYPQAGTFEFADVSVDETTGMVKARMSFPNPDQVLLPGQFVKVRVSSAPHSALLVKQSMTARNKDARLYVWMIDAQGKAKQQVIDATDTYQGQWVVMQGLKEGDQIIASGFQKIKIGDAVKAAAIATGDPQQSSSQK